MTLVLTDFRGWLRQSYPLQSYLRAVMLRLGDRLTLSAYPFSRDTLKFTLKHLGLLILAVAVPLAVYSQLIVPMMQRSDAKLCCNNIRQLGLCVHLHEQAYGHLPLAIETDPAGNKMCSWRTRVTQFLDTSRFPYDYSKPWNSPANAGFLAFCPPVFQSPLGKTNSNAASFVVVVGAATAFPPNRTICFDDITDGLDNTLLIVESLNVAPEWTQPKDLKFETMSFSVNDLAEPSISSNNPTGAYVCFADGAAYFLTTKIKPNELKALLTIRGGEPVTRIDLLEREILIDISSNGR